MATPLSPAEVRQYRSQGHVLPALRLGESRERELREALERLMATTPGCVPRSW
jgi:hypothetical protein